MQAGDGSSVVAGSRPCLGCEGEGSVKRYLPESVVVVSFSPCPVCLGAGSVPDPDTALDAKVDAAAFCVMEASLVDFDPRPKQPSLAAGLDRHRFGPGGLLILSLLLALTFGARPAAAGDRADRARAYTLWCGMKAADLMTTELAFSRGGYESNPLMKDRGVRIGAGAASCVVAAEADHRLRKHTKSRWAVRVLGLGLLAYAVQNNARVGR